MLSERFDPTTLPEPGRWRPHPTGADRAFWDGLPETVRCRFMERGEVSLAAEWPALPASLALLFLREGRRDYEGPLGMRRLHLMQLSLGALTEGGHRFSDAVADAAWSICEESAWNQPAHLHEQGVGSGLPDITDPLLDLGCGDTSATLAWVSYLLADQLDAVSPLIRRRIELECRRRVLNVLLERRPHYWQTAVNNWNPWIISNVLTTALLVETDRQLRDAVITKAVAILDHFIDHYPPDGGCDEGPTYWTRAGGNLIMCLDLLHSATGGALDVYGDPLIGEIGRYVHRMFIGDDWFVNFADGAARFTLPSSAWRYGRAIGDEPLTLLGFEHARRTAQDESCIDLGAGIVLSRQFLEGFGGLLPLLPHTAELLAARPLDVPLVRDAVLPDIQVLVARDAANSTTGWFVSAKGGHNDEVHNHNDVGSLVVFLDGQPILVDAGVGPYTRATFSHERYTIWTMQSGWHSVPVINDVEQLAGREFAAEGWTTLVGDEETSAIVDIAGAYPCAAGIRRWERTTSLRRGTGVDITDRWTFAKATGGKAELRLLTNHEPVALDDRVMRVGPALMRVVTEQQVATRVERRRLEETNMAAIWGDALYRIDVVAEGLPREGEMRIELRQA